ncbi:LuxR C-terminal-related transcriptional regulator [Undibacterium sp. Di24W]|uniref:LuxR C-terminal-related transcriptional regulator n=1 Tax=Undibacterium sp. Di24W TaxID=3413033 RepID=UPI003BF3F1D2
MTILATKLFVPPLPQNAISRAALIARLDAGLSGKLSLICAPAGFGKSTVLSEWLNACSYPSAWLSLDEGDSDLIQFLRYLVASLQTISDTVGAGVSSMFLVAPAPSAESVLSVLLNNIAATQNKLVLVLDDYHIVANQEINAAVDFLIEHLPPQMHLVISTREEPNLLLGRRRAQGQVTEIRQADLRMNFDEIAVFFAQANVPKLSDANILALEERTEGWIAGLKLAAISLQAYVNPDDFIQSFTGTHRFVQDYLIEEVLFQQTEQVQSFLLCTSVLDRFCAPLCDAVLLENNSQETLDYLETVNLFIVPLDNERRWYRYHHLFAHLLRQRMRQKHDAATLHIRASEWYEKNDQEIDAFHQAIAAADMHRVIRLIDSNGMPLYFRGEMSPIVQWLQTQPPKVLDAYPSLWVTFAWSLFIAGQSHQVSPKLVAAEAALKLTPASEHKQDLLGQIAALWAWLGVSQNNVETIHNKATSALELLAPDNQAVRTAAQCALGVVHLFRNERAAAKQTFSKVLETGQSNGNLMFTIAASIAIGGIHASDNQLRLAADFYRNALALISDPTHLIGCEAHLGLARILYEWNELDDAVAHALRSSTLAARSESENGLGGDVLRARVMLVQNDTDGAATLLEQSSHAAKTKKYVGRMQEIATAQVVEMLRRGEITGAMYLATEQNLPLSQARAFLAQGDKNAALSVADQYRRTMTEMGCPNEVLKALVIQVVILDSLGKTNEALHVLNEALAMAESGGFVRLFVDEGPAMSRILVSAAPQAIKPDYVAKLLSVFALQESMQYRDISINNSQSIATLNETYSTRELDILQLMYQGRSNQEISERLFLSLSTVKWHNQNIFGKLQVQRRTEAVARAIELKLLPQLSKHTE